MHIDWFWQKFSIFPCQINRLKDTRLWHKWFENVCKKKKLTSSVWNVDNDLKTYGLKPSIHSLQATAVVMVDGAVAVAKDGAVVVIVAAMVVAIAEAAQSWKSSRWEYLTSFARRKISLCEPRTTATLYIINAYCTSSTTIKWGVNWCYDMINPVCQ